MTTNEIRISESAVDTLTEALDDALTPALARGSASDVMDNVENIARQVLSVLAQFGWELVDHNEPVEDNSEPKSTNIIAEALAQAQRAGQ